MLNDDWTAQTRGTQDDGLPDVPLDDLSFDVAHEPEAETKPIDFSFPPIETNSQPTVTPSVTGASLPNPDADVPVPDIAVTPINASPVPQSVPVTDGETTQVLPSMAAPNPAEPVETGATQVLPATKPEAESVDSGATQVLSPAPPVPPSLNALPLNPTIAAETDHSAGKSAIPEISGSSNVVSADMEDFSEISQTGPIAPIGALGTAPTSVPPTNGAAPAVGRTTAFNPKFVIGGIAVVAAVAVLSAGGAFMWNNRQSDTTRADKLIACQAAYRSYQDAADALKTAVSKSASAQKVTTDQVADAATIAALKKAVSNANSLNEVSACGESAGVDTLTKQTADANTGADQAKELASSLTQAADAVTASQTKKTDADRDKVKQQLTTAVADAQTRLDNTLGAVADDATRQALQSAIDKANELLGQSKPDVKALQDASSALQTALDDVNNSAQELADQNAAAAQQAEAQRLAQQQAAAAAAAAAAQQQAAADAAAKAAADAAAKAEAEKKAQEEAQQQQQQQQQQQPSTPETDNTDQGSTDSPSPNTDSDQPAQ